MEECNLLLLADGAGNRQTSQFVFLFPFQWAKIYRIILPEEKDMAPHFSTLAWKVPWLEGPGRVESMGSRTVGHE